MRSERPNEDDPEMAGHSGWALLAATAAAMAVLLAIFLLYYFTPPSTVLIEEHVSPTAQTFPVHFRIAGLSLDVPANYLPYASERTGGVREQIVLYAELPDLRGYSAGDGTTFAEYGARSPILHVLIKRENFDIAESIRLDRIYLNAVIDRGGHEGPFGLREHTFRDNSGYRGEDLFVGQDGNGSVVMRCTRPGAGLPSATCMREFQVARNVSLSYRFSRSDLSEWRLISDGINRLAEAFDRPPR